MTRPLVTHLAKELLVMVNSKLRNADSPCQGPAVSQFRVASAIFKVFLFIIFEIIQDSSSMLGTLIE